MLDSNFSEGEEFDPLKNLEETLENLLNSEVGDKLFKLTAEVNRKTMNSLMDAGFTREEAVAITAAQGSNML